MNSANPTPGDVQPAIDETMRAYWVLFLVQGVIMMVLGVLAVIWPQISTVAADIYIGWIFLLSGIVGLVTMFWAPSTDGIPDPLNAAGWCCECITEKTQEKGYKPP